MQGGRPSLDVSAVAKFAAVCRLVECLANCRCFFITERVNLDGLVPKWALWRELLPGFGRTVWGVGVVLPTCGAMSCCVVRSVKYLISWSTELNISWTEKAAGLSWPPFVVLQP